MQIVLSFIGGIILACTYFVSCKEDIKKELSKGEDGVPQYVLMGIYPFLVFLFGFSIYPAVFFLLFSTVPCYFLFLVGKHVFGIGKEGEK